MGVEKAQLEQAPEGADVEHHGAIAAAGEAQAHTFVRRRGDARDIGARIQSSLSQNRLLSSSAQSRGVPPFPCDDDTQ